ncbi:MAG: Dam family site-specific DNA-(adenine-N6)-methyltransferase [Clostridia bacterium]|nr:Dam family site-specific DNA-(adenine-N6)-methyltransferase [Clostridia bacterium]
MLAYMTANEAAEKWNISHRRVLTLCKENRITDVAMLGNMWIIPIDAKKPEDARTLRYNTTEKTVKPFLKWAGGKGQLLHEIKKYYPFNTEITKYAEPFVGGGAVLFDILGKYDLKEIYISDINVELMNAYKMVRDNIDALVENLYLLQNEFSFLDTEDRKSYYNKIRNKFNDLKVNGDTNENIEKAALMIFLNKTCFNGLYRVNKKGQFNVPMGSYKNPLICDEENLRLVSEKLQDVTIVCGDYREAADFIDEKTFVYFDPPYRPLTETSGFTAYTENLFNDAEQIELAKFVDLMDKKGAKIVISNSDPKNTNSEDNFFDDIYSKHNINRVEANRMINSKGASRGKIKELLISNF